MFVIVFNGFNKTFNFTTDNKAIEKEFNKALDLFEEIVATKQLYFKGLKDGFKVQKFLDLRAKSVFLTKEAPKKTRKSIIEGTNNIELFELLRELRNSIANDKDLIHYQIFSQKSLYEICETLPTNKAELLKINGFGKTRVEKYGNQILNVICAIVLPDLKSFKEMSFVSPFFCLGFSLNKNWLFLEVSISFWKNTR